MMYYARYCRYGVTVVSTEDYIVSFPVKRDRDQAVKDHPLHIEALSARLPAVRRYLRRSLLSGEPLHNPYQA